MYLSFDEDVEAINDISNFIDILSFFYFDMFDPSADIDQNSKISGNAVEVRLVLEKICDHFALFLGSGERVGS